MPSWHGQGQLYLYFYLFNQLQKIKGITHVCRWHHGKVTQASFLYSSLFLSDRPTGLHLCRFPFPSPTWRQNPPPVPLSSGGVHKIGKVCSKHVFSLRLFILRCLFIPNKSEDSVLLGYNIASQGNRFPTCRKNTLPSSLRVLEVRYDLSFQASACPIFYSCWFQTRDFIILAVIEKLSIWFSF
jgi:hypothetical protein